MAGVIHTEVVKATLDLNAKLVAEVRAATGIQNIAALVHAGLEALIARGAARQLAALGGSEPDLRPIPRRRPR